VACALACVRRSSPPEGVAAEAPERRSAVPQDVRGVNNSDTGLVTCSRDKTIRLWTPVGALPSLDARGSQPARARAGACALL
jgi:hypothetical protein